MDHYLTTYKKDYLWPNAVEGPKGRFGNGGPSQVSRPDAKVTAAELLKACTALAKQAECKCPSNVGLGESTPGHDDQHWSRTQIMGPLLDSKLFPVKVGAAPETVSSRYNQPNAFLDKLQSKFPMLYKVLQSDASPELKQRIERDRNTTTYQVDYCNSGPGAQFESLQRSAGESGLGPCSPPVRLPGDPCRVQQKPRTGINRSFTKTHAGGSGADARNKTETTSAMPPLGKSEYQDGVSKLGALIMRDKLHRRN